MPVCSSACASLIGGSCQAVLLQLQVAAALKARRRPQTLKPCAQTPAALQNMTLDGRAGGATHAVPLNYLHMVRCSCRRRCAAGVGPSLHNSEQVRWFSFEWFKHEALSEFDFVWRMDADLWLKFPVRPTQQQR